VSAGVVRSASPGSGITVSITRDPALVRTVRLIAASVARRTGQDEDFVEEVRLAVGEACALLVGEEPEPSEHATDPVVVSLTITERLAVDVVSTGPVAAQQSGTSVADVEPWTLLRGLVDDFSYEQDGATTRLSMSWDLG
jgi:hypothetical protein